MGEAECKKIKLPLTMEIIRSNILRYGNPLALTPHEISSWNDKLNLPLHGKTLFYTGGEYQLIPYLGGLVGMVKLFDQGSSFFSMMIAARNLAAKTGIAPEKVVAFLLAGQKSRFNTIPYKAAVLLQKFGAELCCLGQDEIYGGALLYEFGFEEDLKKYSSRFHELIKKTTADEIVCLSPHAAELFRNVYPRLIPDFKYKIYNFVEYLDCLLKKNQAADLFLDSHEKVTIHDSCVMARELNTAKEIRNILGKIPGLEIVEPPNNGKWTYCCGGPNKILFSEVSKQISKKRVKELADTGAETALTFCPYCLSSLELALVESGKDIKIADFIEFLFGRVTNV